MKIKKEAYIKHVRARASRSPILKNCIAAFWTGGLICAVGQLLFELYSKLGAHFSIASLLVSVTLIFVAALLTGAGVFDNIAR